MDQNIINPEILKTSTFLSSLPDPQLEWLVKNGKSVSLESGDILIEENVSQDAFYVVAEGDFEVIRQAEGKEVVLAVQGCGQILGEMSAIAEVPPTATVRAMGPSRVLKINRDVFNQLISNNPSTAMNLVRTAMLRLRNTEVMLNQREKLASLGTLAAGLAHEAGFDGVDVKACHGYLVSELLASFTRPDSRYGGSFENRTRFLIETADKIKQQVRGIFVTGRLSLYDAVPFPHGFGVSQKGSDEPDLAEPLRLIKRLKEIDFPVLAVSLGVPAYQSHFGRPSDKPLIGQKLPDEHPLVGVARWLRLTSEVQRAFPSLPVVGAGYSWLRHLFPYVAAAMVESERTSLIGLGRGSIACPGWVNALAADGVLDPRKVCVSCSKCSQMLRAGCAVGCAVQDAEVYQSEYREARKRARQVRRTEQQTAWSAGRRRKRKA